MLNTERTLVGSSQSKSNGLTNGNTSTDWKEITKTARTKCRDKLGTYQLIWLRVGKKLGRSCLMLLALPWRLQDPAEEKFEDHWSSLPPHFSEKETKTKKNKASHPKSHNQSLLRGTSFLIPEIRLFSYQTPLHFRAYCSLPTARFPIYFRQQEQASLGSSYPGPFVSASLPPGHANPGIWSCSLALMLFWLKGWHTQTNHNLHTTWWVRRGQMWTSTDS